jgi:hypothetical protein
MFHSGLAGRLALTALTALTLAGLAACSSEEGSGTDVGNGPAAGGAAGQSSSNGGKSTSGGSSATSGGAPATGVGGGQVIGISGSLGSSGSGPTCAGDTAKAELVPLDIYLMLDSSGSMLNETTLFSDKWTEVGEALVAFLRAPESAGIGVGLQYFPIRLASVPDVCTADPACGEGGPCQSKVCLNVALEINALLPCASDAECDFDTQFPAECVTLGDCSIDPTSYCFTEYAAETCMGGSCTRTGYCTRTASCDVPTYGTPEVAIAALPAAEPALVASLQAKMPEGKTPTAPALSGAIEHVKSWKASHPDHTTIALLATDGLPTECFANPAASGEDAVAEVVAIAADGRADGVQTFVIGVFTEDEDLELGARQNLNRVAMAGGTEQAFIVDAGQDVAAQFLDALNVIRGARLSCEFKIPESDGTREVDLNKVNVDFTMGATTTRVPRVNSLTACDPVRGGWYYDVDPSAGEPSRIIICPTSCQAFQAAQNASVLIELGCASEVIE